MNDISIIEECCERYLRWISGTAKALEELRRLRDNMRANIDGVKGTSYDKVGGGSTVAGDAFADAVARLEAVDERMAESMRRYAEAMDEWHDTQSRMEPRYAAMVTAHYLNGTTWEDIARNESYSERNIYRLRIDALLNLYDVMPQGWQ